MWNYFQQRKFNTKKEAVFLDSSGVSLTVTTLLFLDLKSSDYR